MQGVPDELPPVAAVTRSVSFEKSAEQRSSGTKRKPTGVPPHESDSEPDYDDCHALDDLA